VIGHEPIRDLPTDMADPLDPERIFARENAGPALRWLRNQFQFSFLNLLMEQWFLRQLWSLETDLVHVSADLTGIAARWSSPERLKWLLNPTQDFFTDEEAFVLPAIGQRRIADTDLTFSTGSREMLIDVDPQIDEFQHVPCSWYVNDKRSRYAPHATVAAEYAEFIAEEEAELEKKKARAREVAAMRPTELIPGVAPVPPLFPKTREEAIAEIDEIVEQGQRVVDAIEAVIEAQKAVDEIRLPEPVPAGVEPEPEPVPEPEPPVIIVAAPYVVHTAAGPILIDRSTGLPFKDDGTDDPSLQACRRGKFFHRLSVHRIKPINGPAAKVAPAANQ
jgi:hypothetical protein